MRGMGLDFSQDRQSFAFCHRATCQHQRGRAIGIGRSAGGGDRAVGAESGTQRRDLFR